MLPVNFLVHLSLLRKNYSLIHSAAVEFEGRRYIFPAFGGIGKTILVAAIVFAGGKLYGDDLTIVNNSKVLGYPIDFSVYPYHMPLLKLNDHSMMRRFKITSMLNHITDFLERFNTRPVKFFSVALNALKVHCVNVPPRRIFGENYLAESRPVDAVYYLSRVVSENKDIKVDSIDPRALAAICANILLHEWHASVQYLQVYSALSTFSLVSLYNDTRRVFEHLFLACPCHSIQIPISLTAEQYQHQLLDILYNQKSKVVELRGV